MPQLRKDPVLGRWVIISTERGKRPTDFAHEKEPSRGGVCPFDEGNEDKTPKEVLAYRPAGTPANSPGWQVRVVPNKFPALAIEGELDRAGEGMYDKMNGIGAHEVIIETPRHEATFEGLPIEHVALVVKAAQDAEALARHLSGDAAASPAPVPSLPKGCANSAGRSCSAVATAWAVPASVRCCASRSTRSTSCT